MGKKKKSGAISNEQKGKRRPLGATRTVEDNPFEKRRIKKKHVVLGQKLKNVEFLGQARSQAQIQRKKTLLVEFQQQNRNNAFIDKRIGEKDENLSTEEKMLIRYQKEKQKKLLKKSLFSLDEEQSLTHFGQSLSEIDNFDDYMPSDDEENMGAEITSDYHFGGGLFKKVETSDEPRTREEIMKEVIAKSKYYKDQHQKERELSLALTNELDSELSTLLPHLSEFFRTPGVKDGLSNDEFDVLARELAFDTRAKPLNRLPTPEELAQRQRDRLALLEKERLKRMQPDQVVSDEEDNDTPDDHTITTHSTRVIDDNIEATEGNVELDEEDSDMDDDDEAEFSTDKRDNNNRRLHRRKKGVKSDKDMELEPKPLTEKEIQLIEANLSEAAIPFFIEVPDDSAGFTALMNGRSPVQMRIIIARILGSNNIQLGPQFKAQLQKMFVFTLEYLEKYINASKEGVNAETVDVLSHSLYLFTQSIKDDAAEVIKPRLIAMHSSLLKSVQALSDESVIWKASEFMLFKVISILFPTTDFQHTITTPAILLMNEYIVITAIHHMSQIISKLFLCSMVHHYVKESKRYVPEVINYVRTVLLAGLNQKKSPLFSVLTKKMLPLLDISAKPVKSFRKQILAHTIRTMNITQILSKSSDDDFFADPFLKYDVLFATVTIVGQFASLYESYLCFIEVFAPFSNLLAAYGRVTLPKQLKELISATKHQLDEKLSAQSSTRKPLTYSELKPSSLRTLTPDFVENYIPGRDYDTNQERARMRALKKRVKQEKKGAMRELKKDSMFLEKERMKQRLAADKERAEKLKQVMHTLQSDQHNFNVSKKEGRKK